MKGSLWIGTSNVTLPGNRSTFPPAYRSGSRLQYYGHIFRSVEVNSSFYKTPRQAMYKKWADEVPAQFQFSIKLRKDLTHAKKLAFDRDNIGPFLDAAKGLGSKTGCILIQLPGAITLDHYNKLEEMLEEMDAQAPPPGRKAVEFRHSSWYTGETSELLTQYHAVTVLHDFKKGKITELPSKQEPFLYLRFHGPAGDYRGSYEDAHLKEKARQIRQWLKQGKDVYAYFNNTMGKAFENARTLAEMVKA